MNKEPEKVVASLSQGLVSIFTGNGKGKTSAALGVAVRALGCGLKVCIIYFMKGGSPCNEQNALRQLPNVRLVKSGQKHFVNPDSITEGDREEALKTFQIAYHAVTDGEYDVVILDEINIAAAWNIIPVDDIIALIHKKPPNVELILTGRYADTRLIALADMVTEMQEVKHPYQKGILSREGIDY